MFTVGINDVTKLVKEGVIMQILHADNLAFMSETKKEPKNRLLKKDGIFIKQGSYCYH